MSSEPVLCRAKEELLCVVGKGGHNVAHLLGVSSINAQFMLELLTPENLGFSAIHVENA